MKKKENINDVVKDVLGPEVEQGIEDAIADISETDENGIVHAVEAEVINQNFIGFSADIPGSPEEELESFEYARERALTLARDPSVRGREARELLELIREREFLLYN